MSTVHTCSVCGYSWLSGAHGGHSCAANLNAQIRTAAEQLAGWVIWESIQCFDGQPDHFSVQAYVNDYPDDRDVLETRHHEALLSPRPRWRCAVCKMPSVNQPGGWHPCANPTCQSFKLERDE